MDQKYIETLGKFQSDYENAKNLDYVPVNPTTLILGNNKAYIDENGVLRLVNTGKEGAFVQAKVAELLPTKVISENVEVVSSGLDLVRG